MTLLPGNQHISVSQARDYALKAGFSGASLDTIVAIAQAESGLNTANWNPLDPYGGSFGILQINGSHFQSGAITKVQALDPAASFRYAYQLSSHGTNFHDW